ncbi:MAG: M28 family peptidase [Deltaproteobacteria bacterium]|nr:M28 family peptidase [Deltaproteobacteria bacterium]
MARRDSLLVGACPRRPIEVILGSLLTLAAVTAAAGPAQSPARVDKAALEVDIRYLADDSLEGRGLGSPGLEAAAAYHEKIYRELGLEPFGGPSFRQPFSLVGSLPSPDTSIVVREGNGKGKRKDEVGGRGKGEGKGEVDGSGKGKGKGEGRTETRERKLAWQEDMVVVTHRRDAPAVVEAEAVYAGHFIEAPERGWDDVKGTDLAGKVLIVEINEPENRPGGLFDGTAMTWYGRWGYKFEHAARLGALGVLIIHDDVGAGYGWKVVRNGWSQEELFFAGAPTEKLAFMGWVTGGAGDRILALAGKDRSKLRVGAETRDFRPVPLGVTVRVKQAPSFRQADVANVVGLLRSPRKEAEGRYVVVSAHFDHMGMQTSPPESSTGPPRGDDAPTRAGGPGSPATAAGTPEGAKTPAPVDRIYNGAVDNCSASAAMLATARTLAAHREELLVNVVFLAATAEEDGLLGSGWFVSHLPVPSSQVLANVNFEMTNVWGRTLDAYCISARHSDMEEICRQAAALEGMDLIEERDGEKGYPFRSDQHSFVKAGIPGVWLHEGVKSAPGAKHDVAARRVEYERNHYHQVTDNVRDDWDLEGTVQAVEWAVSIVEVLGRWKGVPGFAPESPFQRPAIPSNGPKD